MLTFSQRLVLLALVLAVPEVDAQTRVPGAQWQRFLEPADAGFAPERLAAARKSWEALPSSAFLIVADGAVVASWGDVERRFMCHSVRKSFLSALYGIYWDRGEVELNQTMEQLGIDDAPSPLLPVEKQARILDLLKARSAVYHPAAYAGRTDSAERGSIRPGQAFGYNNWDFNTLATILMRITGDDVFESFDRHFGQPLGMQDWRISDGYYHYERDKSKYPAYPFRMSARDAARFGLLFARNGLWGEQRILSHHWVNRSTAMYSIDSPQMGYGFMWWVFRVPALEEQRGFAALGVGNQMIAVFPESDLVIVNRANTYAGEATPTRALVSLVEEVLAARTGSVALEPTLEAVAEAPVEPYRRAAEGETLDALVGSWSYPPPALGLAPSDIGLAEAATIEMVRDGDHLRGSVDLFGTFAFYVLEDGSLIQEDAEERFFPVYDAESQLAGFAPLGMLMRAANVARGRVERGSAEESDRERERAIALYERVLEIEPRVEAAREALATLRKQ